MTDNNGEKAISENKAAESEKIKRKSKISKSISRKVQTATFENLQVFVSYEEEVEWSDIKERAKKSEGITKLLIGDFNKTMKSVWDNSVQGQDENVIVENAVMSSSVEDCLPEKEDIKQYDGL